MALFGAKYIKFNPIKETPKNALPIYSDSDPVQLGRLVKADLSVVMASGKLHADDELAESADEFVSGSLAVETDDMEDLTASVVYGCEVSDKEVHYKSGDSPPEGGLAYYKVLMRRGVKSFKGYFYPRTKATLGNDSAQTKGENITFSTVATTFTVFVCNSGEWRTTCECATEAEAKAWVDKKLSNSATSADAESSGQGGEVSG